ncbi:glycosyltransferase [Paenibacillus sp. KS-LC4]|uniref:glycosyltransferase n=1 Tax=Paenibacillus sp. KS-LC4 TaxID=2979727 RepID=UPI0030CF9265
MIVYLVWRLVQTLPSGWSFIFGSLLLFFEIISIFQSVLFHILLLKPTERKPAPLPDNLYSVDVTIATYNEPPSLVRKTILACKNLNYPEHLLNIWVCDDGKRAEMREVAEGLGVHYLDRPGNEHAKAGNLNHALTKMKGDLLLTLDADMMPKPDFLQRTVGFFAENEKLAYVQTPQVFYNEDIFQYNYYQGRNIPNEQDMFMRLVQSGRDRFNAVIYVGSNCIFRRSAIDHIGGFVIGTITEDLATGMKLQSNGFDSYCLNEVLALGLTSESISDQIKQRARWARGTIQTTRMSNPLEAKGLSLMQRLLYFSNLLYWYFGVTRFMYILSPMLFLTFGVAIIETSLQQLLIFWLPYFLFSVTVVPYLTNKKLNVFWNNVYETAMTPTLFLAALQETIFRKAIPFEVTPKGIYQNKTSINYRYMMPLLVLLVLSVVLMAVNVGRIAGAGENELQSMLINLFWLGYNGVFLMLALLLGFERPRMREAERFAKELPLTLRYTEDEELKMENVKTLDISETGCRIYTDTILPLPDRIELDIPLSQDALRVTAEKIFYDKHGSGYQIGFKLHWSSIEEERKWLAEVYGNADEFVKGIFQAGIWTSVIRYISNFKYTYKSINRKSPRVRLKRRASILVDQEDRYRTQLLDISYTGCRIELPQKAAMHEGKKVRLQIIGSAFEANGRLIRVGWAGRNKMTAAIVFDEAFDLSLLLGESRSIPPSNKELRSGIVPAEANSKS